MAYLHVILYYNKNGKLNYSYSNLKFTLNEEINKDINTCYEAYKTSKKEKQVNCLNYCKRFNLFRPNGIFELQVSELKTLYKKISDLINNNTIQIKDPFFKNNKLFKYKIIKTSKYFFENKGFYDLSKFKLIFKGINNMLKKENYSNYNYTAIFKDKYIDKQVKILICYIIFYIFFIFN